MRKSVSLILVLSIAAVLFVSGCVGQAGFNPSEVQKQAEEQQKEFDVQKENAIQLCKSSCSKARSERQDLSRGPCLLNPIPQQSQWVCDIAHMPRLGVDNARENQCSVLGLSSSHFVELDENCQLITAE